MHIIKSPSPHFNERTLPVDTLIIHYTDMPSAADALAHLCHPESQVSAHYLIDEEGKIYQMVEEDKRAWHAGASWWKGCTDLNSCSIGVELANPGYKLFPKRQIDSLIRLCKDAQNRWQIPVDRFLGHSDIAPMRKQDPGRFFPWQALAREGIGIWPKPQERGPRNDVGDMLSRIGYDISSLPHALLAFQRHFQPHKVDGIADEETYALLAGLGE